ncbi:MAG: ankyrin repeat domain-containing protein [Candidatus Micrarchaeota archaeon]|nr:ankyrin repeat domain-containing protein [Candidatus Micrarchaeota archaeon]
MERFEFDEREKDMRDVRRKDAFFFTLNDEIKDMDEEEELYDLHSAIIENDINEVRRLLKKGANPNKCLPGPEERSIFYTCLPQMSKEVFELLYREGAEIITYSLDGKPWWSVFHELAMMDRVDLLSTLLDLDVNHDIIFEDGENLVHVAAVNANALKVLLEKTDLDVNHHAHDGTTPLFVASFSGDEEVKVLLEYGANINERDEKGRTALHHLVISDLDQNVKIEAIKRLLRYGADKEIADNDGKTPLALAEEMSDAEVIEILSNN